MVVYFKGVLYMADTVTTLTNIASGQGGSFNAENLFSIFDSPAFATFFFYVKVFLLVVIFIFGLILLYKFYVSYKIRVTIKTRIGGGGTEVIETRGKITTDDQGKRKLMLYKRIAKRVLTVPVPESVYKFKKGKSDHYELWMDDNYQLHPIGHPTTQEGITDLRLKIEPQEWEAWRTLENRQIRDKYNKKDNLEKYLPAGIMIIACIMAFLIFFFGFKALQTGLAGLAGSFGQVAQACLQMR